IDAGVNQLAGVCVPQRVERHLGNTGVVGKIRPCRRYRVRRQRIPLNGREQQRIVVQTPRPGLHPEFKLALSMLPQGLDQNIGQRDIAAPCPSLRWLEADAVRLGLLQRLAYLDHLAVEIGAAPAQRSTSLSLKPVNSATMATGASRQWRSLARRVATSRTITI